MSPKELVEAGEKIIDFFCAAIKSVRVYNKFIFSQSPNVCKQAL